MNLLEFAAAVAVGAVVFRLTNQAITQVLVVVYRWQSKKRLATLESPPLIVHGPRTKAELDAALHANAPYATRAYELLLEEAEEMGDEEMVSYMRRLLNLGNRMHAKLAKMHDRLEG